MAGNTGRAEAPRTEKKRRLESWQVIALLMAAYDAVAINLSYFAALWVRYDCMYSVIDPAYLAAFLRFVPWFSLVCVAVMGVAGQYKVVWRFASVWDITRTFAVSLGLSLLHIVLITVLFQRLPLSYYLGGMLLQTVLLVAVRVVSRVYFLLSHRSREKEGPQGRVMLIGAGSAGQMIMRDINRAREVRDRVVCIIDDDHNVWGRRIDGIPIVGGRDTIMENAAKYQVSKIFMAIPSASAQAKRDILHICSETGCELKQLPGMYQFVLGQVTVGNMRDVSVEDLLGREPIRADMTDVFAMIHGKTVLVTGGGGSIGSELCRQIAAHRPKRLVVFEIYENNAYDIQLELREKFPELDLHVVIGSVRDSRKVFDLFREYRPEIVYHAAAHKHVPLMEDSPCEAIKNNAIGTYKTAYAAMIHGCRRFVLISTDKAVNPTNIMGASKRLCEMIVQSFDAKIKAGQADRIPELFTHMGEENADKDGTGAVFRGIRTEFVAVRFGNVLGSNGSVIPVFKKQIENGGPITVTHPDIIRYFMTIPEAVSLVMLAGAYAHGGEIFVLDMGSPMKIDTLARNLIRLSGLRPDVDIKIEYTGLRRGEKLYEEKLMAEEGLQKTENDLIHIGKPVPFDVDEFLTSLEQLMAAAYANREDICDLVASVVTTYHPADAEKKPYVDPAVIPLAAGAE